MPKGDCDCNGNTLDCKGNCGGTDFLDTCKVCNGPGVRFDLGFCDCEKHLFDECKVCNGDGIPKGDCDCHGHHLDCNGVCGGDSPGLDEC